MVALFFCKHNNVSIFDFPNSVNHFRMKNVGIDAIVKVSNVKIESSYASELKSVAKQVIGTCQCLGIKIEGKTPKETKN